MSNKLRSNPKPIKILKILNSTVLKHFGETVEGAISNIREEDSEIFLVYETSDLEKILSIAKNNDIVIFDPVVHNV